MMQITNGEHKARPEGLAERIYLQLKADIFEFRLLPGDRFSESEVAQRMAASRTPVRQALFRLEREGYVEVLFRSGWQVRPFDFAYFEELYDLRIVLEQEAVKRLCERPAGETPGALAALSRFWAEAPRLADGKAVSQHDEQFHQALVAAAGNGEMARIHRELTEKSASFAGWISPSRRGWMPPTANTPPFCRRSCSGKAGRRKRCSASISPSARQRYEK